LFRSNQRRRRGAAAAPYKQGIGGSSPSPPTLEGANRQLRKAIKTKGHFPNEEGHQGLIYLAIVNAVPAWTRMRNWTTALLTFKIHFGDRTETRLPDASETLSKHRAPTTWAPELRLPASRVAVAVPTGGPSRQSRVSMGALPTVQPSCPRGCRRTLCRC
jgi:hypothetical protein